MSVTDDSHKNGDRERSGPMPSTSAPDNHDPGHVDWLGQLSLQFNMDFKVVPSPPQRGRPAIPPRDRVRILLRDNCRCVICNSNRNLEIGHIISVAAGRRLGLSDTELFSSENLAAMCRECNGGLGAECPPMPFLLGLLRARLADRQV